ncbi:carboxymuconolactone decarboxylase family protein [Nocardiopsis sp. EMB25]|uniref:carboxymuconolactone decarboxylase family protein n=1 Tax=Nocardiopsis sp. EMB25 TaxID=2835867 RepID=UPI002283DC0E|nr:carboxymuconolactone decarboxylase family protein [Nocardiopsis sp. EMB25]MCY9783622.1 carboxymuconolactone decarboxylase family protein [Nocardiopsis sp. EMB25]
MARLPDPGPRATPEVRSEMERMAAVRSHADGRPRLAEVYVTMFNNPDVARAVGDLGERLRFRGVLPDDLRETAILRFAARRGLDYEWAHHVRPASQAGLAAAYIDALAQSGVPAGLTPVQRAVVHAVDHVADDAEIPDDVQSVLVEAAGEAGVVEVVAICGLYALMGYMCTAFGITTEPGLPTPPWSRDRPGGG